MGVRGYFDEGYSGDRLQGSYFNNLYEVMHVDHPQLFKGIVTRVCFRGQFGGLALHADQRRRRVVGSGEVKFSGFMRRLDMRAGVMTREFVWTTAKGKRLKLTFVRMLSMVRPQCGYQRILFEPLNFSGKVKVQSGLDFSILHEIAGGWKQTEATGAGAREHGKNFWTCPRTEYRDGRLRMLGKTINSGHLLFAGFDLATSAPIRPKLVEGDKQACLDVQLAAQEGRGGPGRQTRGLALGANQRTPAGFGRRPQDGRQAASAVSFDVALAEQARFLAQGVGAHRHPHRWRRREPAGRAVFDLQSAPDLSWLRSRARTSRARD